MYMYVYFRVYTNIGKVHVNIVSPRASFHLTFYALQVVHLASESFHYHKADRMRIKMRRFATEQWPDTIGRKLSTGLPLKVSSI